MKSALGFTIAVLIEVMQLLETMKGSRTHAPEPTRAHTHTHTHVPSYLLGSVLKKFGFGGNTMGKEKKEDIKPSIEKYIILILKTECCILFISFVHQILLFESFEAEYILDQITVIRKMLPTQV